MSQRRLHPACRNIAIAQQRARDAEHCVATLRADIGRLSALPSPGEEGLIGQFEALLALRIAERNDALRAWAALQTRSRQHQQIAGYTI